MGSVRLVLYYLCQCTWGFLQSFFGLFVFMTHIIDKHYFYYGAIVTEWENKSSVSLGMFIFVTKEPYFYNKIKNEYTKDDVSKRLLVHEYGHTVQSLIFGPLYLIIMGIPSTVWGFLPSLNRMRQTKGVSYFSFFTEKFANHLGEKVTHQNSMADMLID